MHYKCSQILLWSINLTLPELGWYQAWINICILSIWQSLLIKILGSFHIMYDNFKRMTLRCNQLWWHTPSFFDVSKDIWASDIIWVIMMHIPRIGTIWIIMIYTKDRYVQVEWPCLLCFWCPLDNSSRIVCKMYMSDKIT